MTFRELFCQSQFGGNAPLGSAPPLARASARQNAEKVVVILLKFVNKTRVWKCAAEVGR